MASSNSPSWSAIQLALTTTTLLLVIGIPLALWLNHDRRGRKIWIETLITLPIVLPPTVIGFYLLILFSPHHPIGSIWFQTTGKTLAFSFPGLVIGSVIYSLPFAVQPFQTAFRNVPLDCMEVAETLGASRWQRFWNIQLPLARRGIMGGATLSFAHTMGEFGVVLILSRIDKLEHFDRWAINARVVLTHDMTKIPERQFKCSMRLSVPGPDLYAEDSENDLYAAIDLVTKKIEQQIRKSHNKRKAKKHSDAAASKKSRQSD